MYDQGFLEEEEICFIFRKRKIEGEIRPIKRYLVGLF